jgi:hypothetical protein
VIHLGDEAAEHLLSLLPLAVQVFHYSPLSFGQDDVHRDWSFLAKAPAPTH